MIFTFSVSSFGAFAQGSEMYELSVLEEIGVLPAGFASVYLPDSKITLGEMLAIMQNILYSNKYGTYDDEKAYTDAVNGKYFGMDENTHYYDNAKYEHVLETALNILGYGPAARQKGNYPFNYISMRETPTVFDGVKYSIGSYITKQDFIKVIFNVFDAKCLEIDQITLSPDSVKYARGDGVLETYRSISIVNGIVGGTCYTGMYKNDLSIAPGKVLIDGELYDNSGKDYSDLVGIKVKAFIYESKSGRKSVKSLMPDADVTKLSFDSEDFCSYSPFDRKLEYYNKDNRKLTVRISPSAAVMLNGCAKPDFTADTFSVGNGTIELYDNDSDKVYDAVYINSYTTFYADYVSAGAKSIYNIYTYDENIKSLSLEEKENVKITVYKNGEIINKSEIKKGDVISVSKGGSDDRGIIKLYVSDKSEAGTVSAVKSDGSIVINAKTYKLSHDYENALSHNDAKAWKINVGTRAEVYTDCFGRIAYIRPMENEYIYGYALKIKDEKDSGIRLLDESATWQDYFFAKKVLYNENRYSKNDIYAVLGGSDFSPQLVKYKLNGDNMIYEIYTAKTDADTSYDAFCVSEMQEGVFQQNNLAFSSTAYLEDDAVLWNLTKDVPKDKEDVEIAGVSSLYSDTKYTYVQYNADEFGFSKYFVLYETDSNVDFKAKRAGLMVIDRIAMISDYDGETKNSIGGMMSDYNDISVAVADSVDISGVQTGDAVTFTTNSDGEIVTLNTVHKRADTSEAILPAVIHTSVTYVGGILDKYEPSGSKARLICGGKSQTLKINAATTAIVCEEARGDVTLTKEQFTSAQIGDYVLARVQNSRVTSVVIYK